MPQIDPQPRSDRLDYCLELLLHVLPDLLRRARCPIKYRQASNRIVAIQFRPSVDMWIESPTNRRALKRHHFVTAFVKINGRVRDEGNGSSGGYAPIVLPARYHLVGAGAVAGPSRRETPWAALERARRQEWVWNTVWLKRVTYFTTVGVSVVLALLPWLTSRTTALACSGPPCALAPIVSAVSYFLPGIANRWVDAAERSPAIALSLVVAIAVLLVTSAALQTRSRDQMRRLWEEALGIVPRSRAMPRKVTGWIFRLRTAPAYQRGFQFAKWRVAPLVTGVATLILLFVSLPAGRWWMARDVEIAALEDSIDFCKPTPLTVVKGKLSGHEPFMTKNPCWATEWELERGGFYRITLQVTEPWLDVSLRATPAGLVDPMPPYKGFAAYPLRRSLRDPWFQPMAKLVPVAGQSHNERLAFREIAPDTYVAVLDAKATGGALFLFVNDAVLSWPRMLT